MSLLAKWFFTILAENWKDRSSWCLRSEGNVAFSVQVLHLDLLCFLSIGAPANSAIVWHVQQVWRESQVDL